MNEPLDVRKPEYDEIRDCGMFDAAVMLAALVVIAFLLVAWWLP